jgi:hypothetical protein
MATSRLKSNIKRKAIHNVILVICGFVILVIVLIFFGANLLTSFSLLVEKSQGNNDTTSSGQQDTTFVAPPTLNTLADAVNKPQVDVSGFGLKNQTIELYVNEQLVDKAEVGSDNKFHFSTVALKEGQNTIKVKANVNNKQSDFSNIDTISYLKNPPSLSISNPQDGQGFSKGSSPTVSIQGQTDIGAKVTVNGAWAIVDEQGKYNYLYTLKDGDNDIKAVATDDAGNQTTKEIHIHTQ